MLRRLLINTFALAGLGLVISTSAAPAAADASTSPTPTQSTMSAVVQEPAATTTGPAQPSSTDGLRDKWCPQCGDIPNAADDKHCNLIVRKHADDFKSWSYPALVFEHDFSTLVWAETITSSDLKNAYQWTFTPLGQS